MNRERSCPLRLSKVRMAFLIILILAVSEIFLTGCQAIKGLIWSKSQQNFVKILSIPQFAALQKEFHWRSRSLETHNFHGEVIKATYYQERNIAEFYDNDTKITGICGRIWHLLAEYHNFTLVPVRLEERTFGVQFPNNTYNGLMGLIERHEAQVILRTGYYRFRMEQISFATPIWRTSFRLFIRPEWKYDNTWVITLFSRQAWYTIFVLFITLSIVGYVLEKMYGKEEKRKKTPWNFNLSDHLFHTFSMMCSQGYIPDEYFSRFKILTLSKSIFAWMILIAFSSNLIHRMAYRKAEPPFNDLQSMINSSNYTGLGFEGSMVYETLKRLLYDISDKEEIERHFRFVNSSATMHRKTCYSPRYYAMFEAEDKQMANHGRSCRLLAIGREYFPTWVSAGIAKDFKYKRTIDMGILKLHEVGIVDGLREHYLEPKLDKTNVNTFKTIDLDQVQLIFTMLFAGVLVSVLVLVIENVVFLCENN